MVASQGCTIKLNQIKEAAKLVSSLWDLSLEIMEITIRVVWSKNGMAVVWVANPYTH